MSTYYNEAILYALCDVGIHRRFSDDFAVETLWGVEDRRC